MWNILSRLSETCSWWRLNSRCARLSVLCFTIWNTRLVLCIRQTVCECMRFTVWVMLMHAQMHPSTFRMFYISIILVIPLGLAGGFIGTCTLCYKQEWVVMLKCFSVALFKGDVHTMLAILLLLTHPYLVMNLCFFLLAFWIKVADLYKEQTKSLCLVNY